MNSHLRYFANDGGPLIVLPREALLFWEGADAPSGGRVVETVSRWDDPHARATDYDVACDAPEWGKMVPVGPSWGLVLGSGGDTHDAWMKLPRPGEFGIARVISQERDEEDTIEVEDARTMAIFARAQEREWTLIDPNIAVTQGDLLLMHAASRGAEVREKDEDNDEWVVIGDAIPFHARPGRYRVEVCEIEAAGEGHCAFLRFVPSGYI